MSAPLLYKLAHFVALDRFRECKKETRFFRFSVIGMREIKLADSRSYENQNGDERYFPKLGKTNKS